MGVRFPLNRLVLLVNAWFVCVAVLSINVVAEDKKVDLFDGESLKGWHGYQKQDIAKVWVVEDNAIVSVGKGAALVSDQAFDNFELRFEWKISKGSDSGILYRVSEEPKEPRQSGPEFQIVDEETKEPKPPINTTASLFSLYGAEKKELKPVGEFNESRIVVRGKHIQHWLNEAKVVECHIGSEDWNKKVAASEFSEWNGFAKSESGHIALQSSEAKVWFRNITIKKLKLEVESP